MPKHCHMLASGSQFLDGDHWYCPILVSSPFNCLILSLKKVYKNCVALCGFWWLLQ